MVPYAKHVGLWLLLFAGAGALVSNIAAVFGYGGAVTMVLAILCVALSLVVGAFSYRLANRKGAVPRSQAESALAKAVAYQNSYRYMSKAQRLRLFWAWTVSGIVFLAGDFLVYQAARRLFPDLTSQRITALALALSVTLAALFGVCFYRRVAAEAPRE